MGNALDVMTFLAYSAALGLLIGVLLGVFALLLAAPAQAAGPASSPMAGSLLLHRPPGDTASPALMLSTETVFRVDGPIQRVRVVQAFRNPFPDRQEGLYVLRLPEEATLERLAVRVRQPEDAEGGASEEEMEDAPDATPEHALISGIEGAGVVTHAIAGIEPGETVLIELEYQQVVRYDRSKSGLRLLTRSALAAIPARRRRAQRDRSVPLGVEGAWVTTSAGVEAGLPWFWLLPVVALYVLVAFFS
jgi:Ca-activated chloride channel family protein